MNYNEFVSEANAKAAELHDAMVARVKEIAENASAAGEKYADYFAKAANVILTRETLAAAVADGSYFKLSMDELADWDEILTGELCEEVYDVSYANPTYAVAELGDLGQILSALYTRLIWMTEDSMTGRLFLLANAEELLVKTYDAVAAGTATKESLTALMREFYGKNSPLYLQVAVREQVDPTMDYYRNIITESDLSDLRYLYNYGLHVTDNEIETAKFINSLPEADVQAMADTFTQGFLIGYEKLGKDIHKKKAVSLYYTIGFERMMRFAINNMKKEGLECVVGGSRLQTTEANRQFEYDHKDDLALVLDAEYVEKRAKVYQEAFETVKEAAAGFAGPCVLETFGEAEFQPENKKEALSYSGDQQMLNVKLMSQMRAVSAQYINMEERSFTIIAYPIPEIGDKFKEIFAETVKVNTLDYKTYEDIQQKLIDVLDQADYVTVTGRGKNRTNLTIKNWELTDPSKQTAYENCVADVNIPVGEVFTSPVLEGTNGLLHVTEVYLNGLKFKDLEIELKDGMITRYTCGNFETEEENKKFMLDNVLFQHESVPIGEFAIGTNTVAYKMGIEYDCQGKLPILIAEKTGPHFAMGDTCFSRSEEVKTFNPDGKEMVAKDNTCSRKRGTDKADEAYFNCHTDITIPYDELDTIVAHRKDGTTVDVIRGGRFVVPGTEKLNEPLDQMNK